MRIEFFLHLHLWKLKFVQIVRKPNQSVIFIPKGMDILKVVVSLVIIFLGLKEQKKVENYLEKVFQVMRNVQIVNVLNQ